MNTKVCCDCGQEKEIEKFPITNYKWRLNRCNSCAWQRRKVSSNPSNYYYKRYPENWNTYQREYARKWRARKKAEKQNEQN